MTAHALRLQPGDDLVEALLTHCETHEVSAGVVISCVGSLSCATLRMAAAQEITTFDEELEIVSLVGTLCADRNHHLRARRDDSTRHSSSSRCLLSTELRWLTLPQIAV
jgi:predicted DNA-binding protein with PD1-like motif